MSKSNSFSKIRICLPILKAYVWTKVTISAKEEIFRGWIDTKSNTKKLKRKCEASNKLKVALAPSCLSET